MSFYLAALKKYAVFSGRAHREEYWMFMFIHLLFFSVAIALDNALETVHAGWLYGLIYRIYGSATIIPTLAATVRRLHDVGISGSWILVGFIPPIGNIWLIITLARDSEPWDNEYGPNPKEWEPTDMSS